MPPPMAADDEQTDLSSGMAVPTANATVSAIVWTPIFPVAPATVIAARTGPAQGT